MRDNYQTDIERLRNSIETAIDRQILTPKDYEYLATCIFNKLHQTVSISTLKRLWGYVPSSTMPRESTLDLLAQFLDYDSWRAFRKDEKTLPVSEMPEAAKKPKPLKTYAIFDCMPDPFSGSPNSKVYCLNKNPGKPDFCFKDDEAFLNATIQNLRLRSDSCFWAENIRNKCGKVHDGVEWLRKRTKSLKDFLGSNPDIFFIEFFPYHSSKGFAFPKHLPSYGFSDALIKQAVKDEELIIIMRERINWMKRLKKTIPDIEDYDNLYTLKCAQGGYLTKDNIVHIDNNGEERHLSDEEITRYFKK